MEIAWDILIILLVPLYILLSVKKPLFALVTVPLVSALLIIHGLINENIIALTMAPAIFLAVLLTVSLDRINSIIYILALLTTPIICTLLIIHGVIHDNIIALTIAPIILLAVLLTVSLNRINSVKYIWIRTWARCILIIIILPVLGIFSFLISSGFLLPTMLCFLIAGFALSYTTSNRQTLVVDVISTIGSCMRQNLPLASALEAQARGRRDNQGLIIGEIARWLEQGFPLSDALKHGYPRCPAHIIAFISMAEQVDQVPLALKALEKDLLEKSREKLKIEPINLLYPFIVMSVAFFIIMGVMVIVIPKFRDIFADMSVPLPQSTELLINFSAATLDWLPALLVCIVIVAVPLGIYLRLRPRRLEKLQLTSRIGDFIRWHTPIVRWFERNASLARTVQSLRLSLRAGCTVDKALAYTLALDVNHYFRKRLRNWLAAVNRGEDIAQAARKYRLARPLVWAFDSQVNQGNTPAILEMLEDFYRQNYSYMIALARYIAGPCIVLLMGIVVGTVVYALFLPIVELIEQNCISVVP